MIYSRDKRNLKILFAPKIWSREYFYR